MRLTHGRAFDVAYLDNPHPELLVPRRTSTPLYIGIGGHVVAINTSSGEEIWRTGIKSSSYVTICVVGTEVYAGSGGELFCLSAASGELLWKNKLKGLGTGLIAFAGSEMSAASMQAAQAEEAASAAAVIAAS